MSRNKAIIYRIVRYPGEVVLRLITGIKVYGKENIPKKGGMLLAGNHIGNSDPLLVCAGTSRTVHFLGKIELFKKPITNWFFSNCGVIPVDRSKNNPDAMNHAVDQLKNGALVGIFPEGTRNLTKEKFLPFKYGAVSIATKAKSKILPFAVQGHFKFFRNELKIMFGKPFSIKGLDLDEANELLKEKIGVLVDELKRLK